MFFAKQRALKAENASLRNEVLQAKAQVAEINSAVTTPIDSSKIVTGDGVWEALGGSSGGVPVVNERTAMGVSAVYACVALISGGISALPLSLYERTSVGREVVSDHDIWWMLNHEATAMFSAAAFWEFILTCLLLGGDGYAEIKRNGRGDILGFEPLYPLWVDTKKVNGRLVYIIYPEGGVDSYALDQDDVLHVPGVGFNGVHSLSPIRYAAKNAIGTTLAANKYNAEFFTNGARADFVLKTDGELSKPQADLVRETWGQRHQGVGNRHLPAVLTGGLDISQLTMSAEDAQLMEILKFSVVDVARTYSVPPHMIAEAGKGTVWGSGIEQLTIGFLRFGLRPHLNRIEQEINRKVFRRSKLYMEFNVDGLLRGDSKAQAEYFTKALGGPGSQGWMVVNEVRRLQNLPPLKGGDDLIMAGAKSNEK